MSSASFIGASKKIARGAFPANIAITLLGGRITAMVVVRVEDPRNPVFLRQNITSPSAIPPGDRNPEGWIFSRCRSTLRTQIINFYVGCALLREFCDIIGLLIKSRDLISSHPARQKVDN